MEYNAKSIFYGTMLQSTRTKRKAGEILFHQTGQNEDIFVLVNGFVCLRDTENNARYLVAAPEILGTEIISTNGHVVHKAQCVTDVTADAYSAKDILSELQKNPGFLFQWLHYLCSRVHLKEMQVLSALTESAEQRLARLLTETPFEGRNEINLQVMNLRDLASLIGTTEQYLYNLFSKLKRQKILSLEEKKIYIINSTALRIIAKK